MAVNDNLPISLVPWRLTGAAPSTIDIKVDVEDPISWEFSGTSPTFVNPLNESNVPVLTGAQNNIYRKGKFRLFIPDSDDRDGILEALIQARLDLAAPYFTWRALDGTEQYRVQFDNSEKMTIGYLGPYRTVDVTFVQVAATLGEPVVTSLPPINPGLITLTSPQTTVQNGAEVLVEWSGIPANSPGDFIAAFLKSDPGVGNLNQFGRLNINTKGGVGHFTFNDAFYRSPFELRMYLGIGPRVIIGPTLVNNSSPPENGGPPTNPPGGPVDAGPSLQITDPADTATRIFSGRQHFTFNIVIGNADASDHVVFEYQKEDNNWYSLMADLPVSTGSYTAQIPTEATLYDRPDQLATPMRLRLVTAHYPELEVPMRGFSPPKCRPVLPFSNIVQTLIISYAGFMPGFDVGSIIPQPTVGIITRTYAFAESTLIPGVHGTDFYSDGIDIVNAAALYDGAAGAYVFVGAWEVWSYTTNGALQYGNGYSSPILIGLLPT